MDGPQKFGDKQVQIRALQFDINIFCVEGEKRKHCTPKQLLVFLLKQRMGSVSFSPAL